MACQTKVREDLVVRIPENRNLAMQVMGDSHFLVAEDVLPNPEDLTPIYRAEHLVIPPATIEEHYSDWLRLTRELERGHPAGGLQTDLPVLRKLAGTLRAEEGAVTAVVEQRDRSLHVLDVLAGHVDIPAYGLAVDVGTTTVATQLVELANGRVIATNTSYNRQTRRGADVISRIDYARPPDRLEELRGLVLETINGLIASMTAEAGVETGSIHAAYVAGNTTMIHLLLGLPPRHIRETPYVPTVNPVPSARAAATGLAIHPEAIVQCAPGVGSYVGGDITAGLLCTEFISNSQDIFLFLDIGTNGEIVIGNAEWMVACACSAGPAFEGSGIKCGMRAAEGAIEYVALGDSGQVVQYDVIGGGTPAGVCGSGLICLLGELFARGVVDQSGRFNDVGGNRLIETGGRRAFVLEFAEKTKSGEDLVITEADIENLIRTKAAIYAACSLILENVGLGWDAISRVYIAGGFGRYIQVADAIQIGMLPDIPHQRFAYLGNSALTGVYIALLSRPHREKLAEIATKMTYVDLSCDPNYMDSYVKAMFLPHTDMHLFPSVAVPGAAGGRSA